MEGVAVSPPAQDQGWLPQSLPAGPHTLLSRKPQRASTSCRQENVAGSHQDGTDLPRYKSRLPLRTGDRRRGRLETRVSVPTLREVGRPAQPVLHPRPDSEPCLPAEGTQGHPPSLLRPSCQRRPLPSLPVLGQSLPSSPRTSPLPLSCGRLWSLFLWTARDRA